MKEKRKGPGRRRVDKEHLELARGSRKLRKLATGALIAWAFIATVGTVALVIQSIDNTNALDQATKATADAKKAVAHANAALAIVLAQQAKQHLQLIQGCERLNIQRATANSAYSAEYRIDKLFFSAVRPTKHQTRRQRRLTREFLDSERTALNTLAWTPLTDCVRAVGNEGVSYKPPAPIPFFKQTPPESAMSATNAALAIPVDSVP